MSDRGDKGDSFAALFERSAAATAQRERFLPGQRVEVTVVAIGRDAVFADLGAKQEGYFDLIELAGPDGKPSVAVGARVSAVIAHVDDGSGQVRLTPVFVRRTTDAADTSDDVDLVNVTIPPAAKTAPLLVEGARVKGKVSGIERYGVFVQITGTSGRGGRGLVPGAETGTPRNADLKKHFVVGQDVEAKILRIDEDGKIRLSFAALAADNERGEYQQYADAGKAEARGFGTLGQLLSRGETPASPAVKPRNKKR